ncbi:MAG: S8 family serine peptidase [Prevotellaceae bacterium]|jgi:subtilisin family serine protease|nr:S8 family serine peptidase [Prevotellaceae bacterium]
MKKTFFLYGFLTFSVVSLGNSLNQTNHFYYYNGQKQYLELDTKHIFISISDKNVAISAPNTNRKPLRTDILEKIRSRNNRTRFWTELSFEDQLSDSLYRIKLLGIKNSREDIIVSPYFKNQLQDKIGLSNFFYVKLKSLNDTILLQQEVEKENATIVLQNQSMPLWFVVSITETSQYNAMEMANRFYESELFQYAEPDLMIDDELNCANDTYFAQQWGLKNTGQFGGTDDVDIKVCDAWQISTGSNVTVAVLDHGIDLSHPDLSTNMYPLSFDSENGTAPQIVKGSHATACAGIIGAVRNNTKGVAGVAPNCKLMSVSNSLVGSVLSRMKRADGINWAWQNGADVISNSWSSGVSFQVINDAIDNAVTQGRSGKGCVVVFSSGNDNASSVSYPASLSNVIAVGAISPCGQRKSPSSCDGETWWGSNYGTNLDVVAPGVKIYTTDIQGSAGNNTSSGTAGDYYPSFNGTSSACPHVAGVAALILSVRPDLTQAQVRQAIESTCTKLSGYSYSSNSGHPNGTWNNQVGHGLVNAYAAVSQVATPIPLCNILASVSATPLPFESKRADIVDFESYSHPAINNTNYLPAKLYNDLQCTQHTSAGSNSVFFYKKFAIPNSSNWLAAVYVKGANRSTIMLCIVTPSGQVLHAIDAAVNLDEAVIRQFKIAANGKIVIYSIKPNSTTPIPFNSSWTSFYGVRMDEIFFIENGKFKQVSRWVYDQRNYRSVEGWMNEEGLKKAKRSYSTTNGSAWVDNEIWWGQEYLQAIYQDPQYAVTP